MKRTLFALITVVVSFVYTQAATLTWSNSYLVGDSSIINDGSSLYAYNLGSLTSSTVVNGVDFIGEGNSSGNSNFSFLNSVGYTAASNSGLFPTNASGYSSGLVSLLDSNVYSVESGFNPHTSLFTLNNLTIGNTYKVQILVVEGRGDFGRTQYFEGGSNNSATINQYDAGGLDRANSVIGEFVADGTTQQIGINNNISGLVSAFQVRDFAVVPEPSTYGMILSVLLIGLFIGRRQIALK